MPSPIMSPYSVKLSGPMSIVLKDGLGMDPIHDGLSDDVNNGADRDRLGNQGNNFVRDTYAA
jgi:hypothetical protein